jgi:hypothetical protein
MFFSGVLFFVFLGFSIATEEGALMIFPFLLFFISVVLMLYARLFSDKNAPAINQAAQPSTFASTSARGSLTPGNTIPITGTGRQHVRTNELAQPPSVTENTTRLLDNE